MSKKNAIVIGAGQTGRGYTARYLFEKGYSISFVDINEETVSFLKEDGAYSIHFYNKDRTPVFVHGFNTYRVGDAFLNHVLMEADLILTAVGEQNLGDISKWVVPGLKGKQKRTVFMTCENGTNPAKVLRQHLQHLGLASEYTVSQTAVFCSTVSIHETRLDILSQNETYFPYDHDELETLDFEGAVPVNNFEKFFERKIYTYNCLAGLISYCGYVKGYEVYGDAANDPDISATMDELLNDLNPALQAYFEITEADQVSFANRALLKFKDKNILDYTIKNGRAPQRKLGPTERIMSPIRILRNNGKDIRVLEFVAAAALVYWQERQGISEPVLTKDPIAMFASLNDLEMTDQIVLDVERYFKAILENREQVNVQEIIHS